jgi:hypothetical protein
MCVRVCCVCTCVCMCVLCVYVCVLCVRMWVLCLYVWLPCILHHPSSCRHAQRAMHPPHAARLASPPPSTRAHARPVCVTHLRNFRQTQPWSTIPHDPIHHLVRLWVAAHPHLPYHKKASCPSTHLACPPSLGHPPSEHVPLEGHQGGQGCAVLPWLRDHLPPALCPRGRRHPLSTQVRHWLFNQS